MFFRPNLDIFLQFFSTWRNYCIARNLGQSAEKRAGSYRDIFKIAVRFYKELNNLSTADFIGGRYFSS